MKKDLVQLQGSWTMLTLEIEGQKYPTGGSKIAIAGDRFVSVNMGAEYEGVVMLDETQSPRTFDLVFEKGPEKGGRSLGIYELEGDTWRICLSLAGKSRPEKFATEKGSGHALEVLQRETATGGREPIDENAVCAAELEGEWRMVSCMQDGKPMDARFVKSARRVFKGNGTTLLAGGRVFMKSRFGVDRSQTPHAIDYEDQQQQGIYEVTGARLRTALSGPGSARPSEFSSSGGDGRTVSEWSRE